MMKLLLALLLLPAVSLSQYTNQYIDTTGATTSWRSITVYPKHIGYLEVANDTVSTVTNQYLWVAFEDDTSYVAPFLRTYPLRGNEVRDWNSVRITHIWIKSSTGHIPARVLLMYD